jgi:hypothetical protein
MKFKVFLIVVAALLLVASMAGADEVAGLPLHVEMLGDGAIRV